ncbi:MAG: hypothetical protein NXI00_15940 [Cytophagales bacterium]|nr:hypothetical protein [Cytophagales bacterium]
MRYIFACLFFITQLSHGQLSYDEYLLEYKEAVQLYASQEHEAAIEKLTPLTSRQYTYSVAPYSLYYFALASIDANKAYQARGTLRDLMQRYPDWEKIDEAYYLYGYANLLDKYFDEGIGYLDRIRDEKLKEKSELLKKKYISDLENVTLLKELNQKFPGDETIAFTLVKRIQGRSYNTKADLELSDLLTNRFDLQESVKPTKYSSLGSNFSRPYDDKVIDIGLLLPFELNDFNVKEGATTKRYVFDLYLGMQMAAEHLRSENIDVKIYGFDVDRSEESLKKYLEDKNFKKLDIVVGPLYGKPNKLVEDYAEKNKIIQLHPVSNNSGLIADSDSRFLLQASNKSIASSALDFAERENRPKTVSIYHDGSRKDSILAAVYAAEAVKRGYSVNETKRFDDVESISSNQKAGHVFITGSMNFGAKVLRALGQKKVDEFVLASASSFNMETISRTNLRKSLYLIYPEFVSSESESYKTFKRAYINKMKSLPSYYTFLGYDTVLYFARMMKDGKEIFRLNLDESPEMNDTILSGFDYSDKSYENKIVPIVTYSNGVLEIINQ